MGCLKFIVIAAVWMVAVPTARAFSGGDGHNGPLVVSAAGTVVNAYTKVTAPVAIGASSVTVQSTTGFAAGDSLLIWHVTGLSTPIHFASPARFEFILLNPAGVARYELRRVKAVTSPTELAVDRPFAYAYDSVVGAVQVVRVPEYSTLTINEAASITGLAWNGTIGGIVAVRVKGTATINGTISVASQGFRGGRGQSNTERSCVEADEAETVSPAKNGGKGESHVTIGARRYGSRGLFQSSIGGGGGQCPNGGGGGGGHAGLGGQGGRTFITSTASGLGGSVAIYRPDQFLSMGGGGGGGHASEGAASNGGQGGGVVWLVAGNVVVGASGTFTSVGDTPAVGSNSEGGSGGGAGGLIYVESTDVLNCEPTSTFIATGGNGLPSRAPTAGGGGGSGGFVYQLSANGHDCSFNAAGGANGNIKSLTSVAGGIPACGDGIPASHSCDDGRTDSGDGCSSACSVEPGYACTDSPSRCTSVCGDGLRVGTEACDDGPDHRASSDGCSAACNAVEPGYGCTTATPNVCTPICGDGVRVGIEACDDGPDHRASGDGCSATCVVEPGYTCSGAVSNCRSVCGDGVRASDEACDDGPGHRDSGDGCSSACSVESGYRCTSTVDMPDTCATVCGDGVHTSNEACDDGNALPGDGCSSACSVESGFTCEGESNVCVRILDPPRGLVAGGNTLFNCSASGATGSSQAGSYALAMLVLMASARSSRRRRRGERWAA